MSISSDNWLKSQVMWSTCEPYFHALRRWMKYTDVDLFRNRIQCLDSIIRFCAETTDRPDLILVCKGTHSTAELAENRPSVKWETGADKAVFENAKELVAENVFQVAGIYFQRHILDKFNGKTDVRKTAAYEAMKTLFRLSPKAGLAMLMQTTSGSMHEEKWPLVDLDDEALKLFSALQPLVVTDEEYDDVKTCSNPGCDQPGTNQCSACKTTVYCCVICQTADWAHHKEECPGHLRKVGMAHLAKAKGFHQQQNWLQILRYGELAATKLKQLKDRRLETVEAIDEAMTCKFNALTFMARHREALECIKECYTLWAMNHLRNPGSMNAALALIQSCIHNKEFEDAERYARHAYFMIAEMTDNFIPADQRPKFLAEASYWLAVAILEFAKTEGIPPEVKQKAGDEAIALARTALEMRTQLHGIESAKVAGAMGTLAGALDDFNDVDDDEILRLIEQAIAIYRQIYGSSTFNVAVGEKQLGNVYVSRADRAKAANDLDRCMTNLRLALPHYREAARIFRVINHVDSSDGALRNVARAENKIRQVGITRAAASTRG